MKRAWHRFIAIIVLVGVCLALAPKTARAVNCSADDAIAWCKSQEGKYLEYDNNGWRYQCVDFVMTYYATLGVSPAGGNGQDYSWNTLPDGWVRYPGGTPQKGDIIYYGPSGDNPYGHVAIYESEYSTYHQNCPEGSPVKHWTIRYDEFTNPYWGCIRPNFIGGGSPSVNLGDNFYAYISMKKTGLHVTSASDYAYTQLSLAASNDSFNPHQIWHFVRQSDGSYMISNASWEGQDGSSWFMQADNAGTTNGTIVNCWKNTGSSAQKWYISEAPSGGYLLKAANSGLVMRGTAGGMAAGTKLDLYAYASGASDQIFSIDKLSVSYGKPSKPSAPEYAGRTTAAIGETIVLNWNISPKVNSFDYRTYTLTVKDSAGKVILSETGLNDSLYRMSFDATGTYTVQLRAVNEYYYGYYTDSPVTTITIAGEKDTEPPVITSFEIVSQTDRTIVFDVQATDNVGVYDFAATVFTASGTGDSELGTASSARVTKTEVGAGHVQFSVATATSAEQKQLAGSRHALRVSVIDASNNAASENCYFEYEASPHLTLTVGDTINKNELIGISGSNVSAYKLRKPDYEVLSYEETTGNDVFTANTAGTGTYVFFNLSSGRIYGSVVTVVEPEQPKIDISDATVTLQYSSATYTGSPLMPTVTVTLGGKQLVAGTDYIVRYASNVNVGTATVMIQGMGSYDGAAMTTFEIVASAPQLVDISGASIAPISDQTYTGAAIRPEVTISMFGTTLVEGSDYTVSYANNTNEGTATITIRGIGDYTGTTSTTFRIVAENPEPPAPSSPFRDVTEKTPHCADILWLADSGISAGWTEKDGTRTFRPTSTVIRQDMAAFLFRLAKLWGLVDDSWQPTGKVTFTDVNANTPHYREIMWLAESGVSAGWAEGDGTRTFRPRNTVVRQDMAAFLRRLQALRDPSVKDWKSTGDSPFRDVASSTPHSEDILWLAESGVSAGWKVGDTKEFRPMNTVIRQDMAAFLHRLDGVPVGVELSAASEAEVVPANDQPEVAVDEEIAMDAVPDSDSVEPNVADEKLDGSLGGEAADVTEVVSDEDAFGSESNVEVEGEPGQGFEVVEQVESDIEAVDLEVPVTEATA